MLKFEVDREKCLKCGLCVSDCLTGCIEQDSEGIPQMTDKSRCINCQHCFMICPAGAVVFNGKTSDDSEEVNFNKILPLIKSRRSIRKYKQNDIPKLKLEKLKSMLPYIPTGCNSRLLHFSIVENKGAMDVIRRKVTERLIKSLSYSVISPVLNRFSPYKDAIKKGEDIIFRGAPHMIVVSSSIMAPCASVDPIIALSYFELYAQSLGIGTCWCGFAQACIKSFPDICDILKIPEGYTPKYAMLFGEPDVEYKRTPQPEPYMIESITSVEDIESKPFLSKARRVITNFIR